MTFSLPIFPLAGPALFPHCAAPLHIFEPRYRAMVADAIAGERRIGMVTVRSDALGEMSGDPPVFAIGCAGFIAQHQRLADGRYLITLQATSRFRIVSELPRPADRLYRIGKVELLGEELGDEARARAQRDEVVRELRELLGDAGAGGELDLARIEQLELGRFAGEICQALQLPGPEKQALLEAATTEQRIERLAQTLAFYRTLSRAPGGDGATLH
ncbi:MAG: LON peptidase substrate-binding domain-containing protein [Deltaproteobacteria bacterium]|nr:LON peptidase substrate-binding domain-containing protein [Deltaproteobacteria bacterium]